MIYKPHSRKPPILKLVLWLLGGLLLVCFILFLIALNWYNTNLKSVINEHPEIDLFSTQFGVGEGSSASQIADQLAEAGLIRSATAFKLYIRLNHASDDLQAGLFEIQHGWDVAQIVDHLSTAAEEDHLEVTIIPGRRLDQLATSLVEVGFSSDQVKVALSSSSYRNHPVYQYLPPGASLEGYIFPETFFVEPSASATDVIRLALDQFVAVIEAEDLQAAYRSQGLSIAQAVTLASIVEQEVGDQYHDKVAQVFLKRYKQGTLLGSDVTFIYAAAVDGGYPSPELDHPYNTRLYPGLPPGPISNVGLSALRSVAFPADTDYFFFVAGDNGNIYFNETLEGHLRDAETYCHQLCQLPPRESDD